jgi:hypothetical protein
MRQTHATGLNAAEMVTRFVAICGATKAGADYVGADRDDGRTMAEVVAYLAKGGRSLYASDADQTAGIEAFADELVRQMDRIDDRTSIGDIERYAKAGIVGGLRKGSKLLAERMVHRLETQSTTSGAPASKVTTAYAKQRERKHGVAASAVYVASRQLADRLLNGAIKIRFESSGIGKAISAMFRK